MSKFVLESVNAVRNRDGTARKADACRK